MWKLRHEDRPGQSLCIVEKDGQILGAFRCNKEEFLEFQEIFAFGLKEAEVRRGTFTWPNLKKNK